MQSRRILFVLLLAVLATSAHAECWLLLEDIATVDYPGHPEWGGTISYYYSLACWDSTQGTNDPPAGGTPVDMGNPPRIWIRSLSDANPENPVLSIGSENADSIQLLLNGTPRNTYSGGTTSIILDSLRQFGSGTDITVQATNQAGMAWATAHADRQVDVVVSQLGMYVRFYEQTESGDIKVADTTLQRALSTLVTYTNYNVSTDGARNGRVFHDAVEDVLGWNELLPSVRWVSTYLMSSVRMLDLHDEMPCNAGFPGLGYANTSALCTEPEEFAFDWMASATASIPDYGLDMSTPAYPTYFVPASITVNP